MKKLTTSRFMEETGYRIKLMLPKQTKKKKEAM